MVNSFSPLYNSNLVMFVLLIIILFIIIFLRNNINNDKKEGMSGGTLTQLLAKDSQDIYINSNVDKLATGNNTLFWNQPTRVMNTYMNRGSPLPTFILPNTSLNPNLNSNPYALEISNNYNDSIKKNNISEELKNYKINMKNDNIIPNPLLANLVLPTNQINNFPELTVSKPRDQLYQSYYDNLLYNKDCNKDPASCGGGAGGSRLGEDFNKSTNTVPYVNISGNNFYPDSYVGSYFMEPNFDIMRPIPWMPDSNLPPNPIKMG